VHAGTMRSEIKVRDRVQFHHPLHVVVTRRRNVRCQGVGRRQEYYCAKDSEHVIRRKGKKLIIINNHP